MKNKHLLTITGQKKMGKSTVANLLSEIVQLPVAIVPFAGALKQEVVDLLEPYDPCITLDTIEGNKEFYRPLLQFWGTYQKKLEGEDYWIRQVDETIFQYNSIRETLYIVPDCRYSQEYDWVKSMGGFVLRVLGRETNDPPDTHSSEAGLPQICTPHYILENDGSLEDLKYEVEKTLIPLLEKFYETKLT